MDIKVIGIDLAKNVFQVCVCLMDNSVMSNKKVNRNKLLDKIRQFPEGSLIAMEYLWYGVLLGKTISSSWLSSAIDPCSTC